MVPGESTQMVPFERSCCSTEQSSALCIIRDMTVQLQTPKVTLILPSTTTAVQLMEEVGRKCHYQPDSFELFLQHMPDLVIAEQGDHTLEELGFKTEKNARNVLVIEEKNGEAPRKTEETSGTEDKCQSDTSSYANTYVPRAPPPYSFNSSDFSYVYNFGSTGVRQETGFVGLVNQAMTCYLNSLLQTLYMTPEFRNAMYRFEFDVTEEEGTKSIPYQLQRLFLLLQTSTKPAVGTTELTTSFGWDSSEAWQQHDVQELCRVMFDALEQKFKNTDQADLISRLYEGKLKDYVKCLECGNESAREDTFLDVPLVVRPFGSNQTYGSVEEALHAFVTPETLDGCNQYFCEQCNKKCDAHKGLKFINFPYLLTLQLKRFDFDPATMHRIKLNDKVTFPEILNLNEFVKADSEYSNDDGDTTDSGSAVDDDCSSFTGMSKLGSSLSPETSADYSADIPDDDEGIDMGSNGQSNSQEFSTNERNLLKSMEKGPFVYELFSIMVHSGSANGGHYYAYIKSFQNGQWYCFNDAQVTQITYDDIRKTYGGGPTRGYYSSAYCSSTNAYMLMYRQIDKERNCEPISAVAFPDHIKNLLEKMQEQEEKERQQRELDRCMCKIKLFCQHPLQNRMLEMRLKVHKDDTLAETTATAHKIMGLEDLVPLDCCRLVKYDEFHDSLDCSFEDTDQPMGDLLGGVKSSYKFDLLLEMKKPEEEFQVYRPGGTTVKVHVIDVETEEISRPVTVRGHLSQTVEEFKQQIAQTLGVETTNMRVVLERYTNDLRLLTVPTKTLKIEGFYRSNKVFVEHKDPVDASRPFLQSKFYRVLDRYEYTICIHISLPTVNKEVLEWLCVNSNNECNGQDSGNGVDSVNELDSGTSGTSIYSEYQVTLSKYPGYQITNGKDDKQDSEKDTSKSTSSKPKTEFIILPCCQYRYQAPTTPDMPQDFEEGSGDNEICDSSNGYGGHTVHSDQSEDSSLTDSERTLVGDELSPRNNSPDIGNEMENDSEQKTHLSSCILKADCEIVNKNLNSTSPSESDYDRNMSSGDDGKTEENIQDTACPEAGDSVPKEDVKRYFKAYPYTDHETGERMLRVYLDKRITLGALKKELVPWVNVDLEYFKLCRLYSNNQEFECMRLGESLMSYDEDTRLTVKLGRALQKGEYRVKIFQLLVNDAEHCKFLTDWVFRKGMTVAQAKKEILPKIKKKYGLDIPFGCCRLREKSFKSPGTVFLNDQCFEEDICVLSKGELFIESLPEPDKFTSVDQCAVFVRRWHSSTYQLDPIGEIVLDKKTFEELINKLSELSGIPPEFIEFANGQGTFPCDTSLLSIHSDLEWHSQLSSANLWNPYIISAGHVIYHRDKREQLKILTEEEKREISSKENSRLKKLLKSTYSPRKEKALKIYTDSTPKTNSKTESIPDLD